MDPTTTAVLVVAGVLVLVIVVLFGSRRSRERGLEPVRLGPRWSPLVGDDPEPDIPRADPEIRSRDVQQRTGLDRTTVDTVLAAWDEYLAVIGLGRLPVDHRYRVYDPYDPPMAERGPEGPVADPVRVARDVERRTRVPEADALAVLDAVHATSDGPEPV